MSIQSCRSIGEQAIDERPFAAVRANPTMVPKNSFALACSVEYFHIPKDVWTICVVKSTDARCRITREHDAIRAGTIRNTENLYYAAAMVYANQRLFQILVFSSGEASEIGQEDRKGNYQGKKDRAFQALHFCIRETCWSDAGGGDRRACDQATRVLRFDYIMPSFPLPGAN